MIVGEENVDHTLEQRTILRRQDDRLLRDEALLLQKQIADLTYDMYVFVIIF